MFDSLSSRLETLGSSLRSRGRLSDADLEEALSEVRSALLEADVELSVVRAFLDAVRERVRGENVAQSLTPGQHVIKAVHDQLVEVLGGSALKVTYASRPPTVVLLAGRRSP
jgi:signal recognition particle subunit SRP54